MSRRRLVAIASASAMLLLGLLVLAAILATTQTEFGRERVRKLIVGRIASGMKGRGSFYVGRISGSFIAGVTIDSLEIRDGEDSLFVATGPVRVKYDPRDLLDKRILLAYLEVNRPVVNLRRHADRAWNYQRIFRSGAPKQPRLPRAAERGFGDYIVIDSAVVNDGTFVLTEPWSPPDWLDKAQRDSAVRAAPASTDHEIRLTGEGLKQTRRWNRIQIRAPHARLADPDSAGMAFSVGQLDVDETDPPFSIRNVRGPVRVLGDSVWFDIAHFDLPGSTGKGRGKVWWGGDQPIRWDVAVTGDSVSLADIAWVHPTLPRTGGGSMQLTIRNDPRDLELLNFAVRDMDVRTTRSRLRGAMTFGVGRSVLEVKDVAMEADPLNFDLLRTFNGGPFPVDWQGNITGQLRGKGGPINRFQIDDARLSFRDAHVPGATSVVSGRGEIDILEPADTKFHAFAVNVATLDLRTIRYLFPDFPRLNGSVRGTAVLDSSWQDVRVSNADVEHRDGPGLPSRVTGAGRFTLGEKYVEFDAELSALPLSFTTLARSYPALRFRGPYTGPLRVKGTIADMELATSLAGPAGQMSVDGRFDFEPPALVAHTTGSVTDLDLRTLLERPDLRATRLNGRFDADIRGDSLATLDGTVSLALERSLVDALMVEPSRASLTFGGGRMRVDSLQLATEAGRVLASGALGLTPEVRDTLRYRVILDSLGGLRSYLRPPPSQRGAKELAATDVRDAPLADRLRAIRDSLDGRLESEGALIGSLDTLAVLGTLTGSELFVGGDRARRVRGSYAFMGVPWSPAGTLRIAADSMRISGVHLDTASAELALTGRSTGTVTLSAVSGSERGAFRGEALLDFARTVDATRVVLDRAGILVRGHSWSLAAPAHITVDSTGTRIDSLVLRNGGGSLALRGTFPINSPVDGTLTIDSLSLADFGALAQTSAPLDGTASLALHITGMRDDPTMRMAGRFAGLRYGDLRFPYFTVRGDYADRTLQSALEVFRNDKPVLTATGTIPVDLALTRVSQRTLDEPLSGQIRADSVDLSIIEALSSQVTRVTGTASTAIDIGGTWRRPTLSGHLRVQKGAMGLPSGGIALRDLEADIAFTPDSVKIGRLTAKSGNQSNSLMSLSGGIHVPNYRDRRTYGFDLTMRAANFQAVNKRALARLDLSGVLQLTGTFQRPVLGGNITLDRGAIYFSDISQKQVINLNDPEFYNLVDTSLVANRALLDALPPDLQQALDSLRVPSLQVRIGDDVWLRSQEANIKLAGEMELAKLGKNQRQERGTLRVSRGTYRLDLGVVQRTFQVDSGSVSFYGDPRIPAELDIDATYTVRQAIRESGQDLKIIAHIGGTIAQPRLDFRTEERIPLSDTEILSYLVFGQPSFIAANDPANIDVFRSVAAALLPSVGAVLERALTSQISFIDLVQVQTGGTGRQDGVASSTADSRSVLEGTRIGLGKQIGERTFVTANAGLCGITGRSSGTAASGTAFYNSLGLTVEHRLKDGYSLQASVEPSTVALQCRPGSTIISTKPQQIGFDLFGEWHF